MSFTPLNTPEINEIDLEKHTKEVQLENALTLYQDGLKLHLKREWDEAINTYNELLTSDLLKENTFKSAVLAEKVGTSIATSNVGQLRYLIFKNHGSLLLDRLQQECHTSPPEVVQATLRQALKHDADDDFLWNRIAQLGRHLVLKKLTRCAYEALASNGDDQIGLLYDDYWVYQRAHTHYRLEKVMRDVDDSYTASRLQFHGASFDKEFWNSHTDRDDISWLTPFVGKVDEISVPRTRLHNVRPSSRSWLAIGRSVAECETVAKRSDTHHPVCVYLDTPQERSIEGNQVEVPSEQLPANSLLEPDDDDRTETDSINEPIEDAIMQDTEHFGSQGPNDVVTQSSPASLDGKSDNGIAAQQTASVDTICKRKRSIEDTAVSATGEDEEKDEETSLRASKRVKEKVQINGSIGYSTSLVEALPRLFEPLGVSFEELVNLSAKEPADNIDDIADGSAFDDFKVFLYRDWSDEIAQSYAPSEHTEQATSFSTTLTLGFQPLLRPSRDAEIPKQLIDTVFDRLNSVSCRYISETKIEILLCLLMNFDKDTLSNYMTVTWSHELRDLVLQWIKDTEKQLLNKINQQSSANDGEVQYHSGSAILLSLSQAIYELCLDEFVAREKSRLELEPESQDCATIPRDSTVEDRAIRWRNVTAELLSKADLDSNDVAQSMISIRFRWANTVLEQLYEVPAECIVKCYILIRDQVVQMLTSTTDYPTPNCEFIGGISFARLDLEISKFRTMDFFNAVFESTRHLDHQSVIEYLEPVLAKQNEEDSNEEMSLVKEYLVRTPVDFRLQLWILLRTAYRSAERNHDAMFAAMCSLEVLDEELHMPENSGVSAEHRQRKVLKVLHSSVEVIDFVVSQLSSFTNVLEEFGKAELVRCLNALAIYAALLMIFVYYEDSTAEDDTVTRRTPIYISLRDALRTNIVKLWYTIYRLYRCYLDKYSGQNAEIPAKLSHILNILHDELGVRGYCSLADGIFLELLESELYRLDRVENEYDLIQVLHCRYDITFQSGTFFPFEHHTKPGPLNATTVVRILPFVCSFLVPKHPGLLLPRADLKKAVDRIQETIFDSNMDYRTARLAVNQGVIETYLSRNIVINEMKDCLTGRLYLNRLEITTLADMTHSDFDVVRNINYVEGTIHLSQYRNRNKSVQGKNSEDLEEAIRFYLLDLELNPRRIDSWRALGAAYTWEAEDELSWNAEIILNSRKDISDLQRKSILCYMMATSLTIQELRESDKPPVEDKFSELLFDFGCQVYAAARPPMSMGAFSMEGRKYFSGIVGIYTKQQGTGVSTKEALKIAARCLHRASRGCPEQWRCWLLLGKTHEKLEVSPNHVLSHYETAIATAPERTNNGNQEPLLDPHYRMASSVSKYMIKQKITAEMAADYLRSSSYMSEFVPVRPAYDSVMEAIKNGLKKMRDTDKKHWHHRPVYRCMQIAISQHDLQLAITEIENLFHSRNSSKGLISIWRPEFERPGRHFVYANQYVSYYVDLLVRVGDADNVRSLLRRVRRAGSSVLNHKEIWEKLCLEYTKMVISEGNIGAQTGFIGVISTEEFTATAALLELACTMSTFQPTELKVLRDLYDLRKLNGGLFDSTKIDNIVIDCYLTMYRQASSMSATQLGVPETAANPVASEPTQSHSNANNMSILHFMNLSAAMRVQTATTLVANPTTPSPVSQPPRMELGRSPITSTQTIGTPKTDGVLKVKDPKISKITRKDVLSKAFALCKPKVPIKPDAKVSQEPQTDLEQPAEQPPAGSVAHVRQISVASSIAVSPPHEPILQRQLSDIEPRSPEDAHYHGVFSPSPA